MRTCLNIALFPVGVLVTLILLAHNSLIGDLLGVGWAFLVTPVAVRFVISRTAQGRDFLRDLETDY